MLVVKSTVILVSGWQPALIFELAPLLMSVAVQVLLSVACGPPSRSRLR